MLYQAAFILAAIRLLDVFHLVTPQPSYAGRRQYKPLTINNELFNNYDPRVGETKFCTVVYWHNGYKKSHIAAEHGVMSFDWDITYVSYKWEKFQDETTLDHSFSKDLKFGAIAANESREHGMSYFNEHPEVLAQLMYFMDYGKDFEITNELMPGDPKEGKTKNLEIQYKNVRWGGEYHESEDNVFSPSHKKYTIIDREGATTCFKDRLGFLDKVAKDLTDPWFYVGKGANKASQLDVGKWLTESFRRSWATRS
ncbi:Fc.00g073820.m01.CDS01 [Cosmosporella sp. VM-42]